MMLAYNLFLLFKIDMVKTTEYRQQIKTFRLKYVFLAGKVIRTARSVVMKLIVITCLNENGSKTNETWNPGNIYLELY